MKFKNILKRDHSHNSGGDEHLNDLTIILIGKVHHMKEMNSLNELRRE